MKYYIATGVENRTFAKIMVDALEKSGHQLTYDWMQQIDNEGHSQRMTDREIAKHELKGVSDGEYFIGILPGGRGTHVEIGLALAMGKKIILCAPDERYFYLNAETCPYYSMSQIDIFIGGVFSCIDYVANIFEKECLHNERRTM